MGFEIQYLSENSMELEIRYSLELAKAAENLIDTESNHRVRSIRIRLHHF